MFYYFNLLENIDSEKDNTTYLFEDIDSMRKYYTNIKQEDFIKFIEKDPTYRKDSNTAGKYAKWILALANKNLLDVDNNHVFDLLTRFDSEKRYLKNKDIMTYKSLEEVESMLNDEDSYLELSDRQKLRQVQKEVHNVDLDLDSDKIYEDAQWEIWVPHTWEASCKLGRNSHWCTATTESDYYFNYYDQQGKLYIIINKQKPEEEKYQLHLETNSFMDINDNSISLANLFDNILSDGASAFLYKIFLKHYTGKEDRDEPVTEHLDQDDFEIIITSNHVGGRDGVSKDTFISLLFDPLEEILENWNLDTLLSEVSTDFSEYDYNFSPKSHQQILDLLKLDDWNAFLNLDYKYDRWDDVLSAFGNALLTGYEIGSMNDAHTDCVNAVIECLPQPNFKCNWLDSENCFEVITTAGNILDYLIDVDFVFDTVLHDDACTDAIYHIIDENLTIVVPYSDWVEFDSSAFENQFITNLIEEFGE